MSEANADDKRTRKMSLEWLQDWRFSGIFIFVALLVLLAIAAFFPSSILTIQQTLLDNLPLTLPVLSVILSIIVGVKDLLKPFGWLSLPTSLALGLVSFSIWYQVTAQSAPDPVIQISANKYLVKDYGMLLLVISFIWATICTVAKVLAESIPEDQRRSGWYVTQAVLLTVSTVALGTPFFLFERGDVAASRLGLALKERFYSVSIAYRDPALATHVGVQSEEIVRCYTYKQVRAVSPEAALTKALNQFKESPVSRQFVPPSARPRNPQDLPEVPIYDAWVVVGREPGIPLVSQSGGKSGGGTPP